MILRWSAVRVIGIFVSHFTFLRASGFFWALSSILSAVYISTGVLNPNLSKSILDRIQLAPKVKSIQIYPN